MEEKQLEREDVLLEIIRNIRKSLKDALKAGLSLDQVFDMQEALIKQQKIDRLEKERMEQN